MSDEEPLLLVDELQTVFQSGGEPVRAVDGLSFAVERGETVCLVGESGSGKTAVCDSVAGLVGAATDVTGEIRFDGDDLLACSERELRAIRGDRLAYVFQNAQNALDPVYTVGAQIAEAVTFHDDVPTALAHERAVSLLETVGLSRPAERVEQYPHELSDGMCQRVALAIALASDPDLLIADEPTSALDVMVQARIVSLLDELGADRSMLIVTHDLRVVAALADRIVVLYGGTAVEHGPAHDLLERPAHPYTQELFSSFAGHHRDGVVRSQRPDAGCRFHRECPHAVDDCRAGRPPFESVEGNDAHRVACVYHAPDRDAETVLAGVRSTAELDADRAFVGSHRRQPTDTDEGGEET